MKILLTAFDPFGGDKINPALEAVKLVRPEIFDAEIIKVEIPTVFGKSIDAALAAMEKHHPDVVLCIGQAGGRFDMTPERVAINVDDARIADNEGQQPVDRLIFEDGEPAYFSMLPIKAMVQAMKDAGIPASVSNTAGTFVCNHIMYGVLYHISKMGKQIRAGFIHVPYTPEQVAKKQMPAPSLSASDICRALEAAVGAIVKYEKDVVAVSGKIS